MSTAVAAQRKPFVGELLGRSDYAIIGEIVEPGTRVLDLGCGEGELLEWLAANKDHEIVVKLNAAMRQGRYAPELWQEYTGKTVDELWTEYLESLRAK